MSHSNKRKSTTPHADMFDDETFKRPSDDGIASLADNTQIVLGTLDPAITTTDTTANAVTRGHISDDEFDLLMRIPLWKEWKRLGDIKRRGLIDGVMSGSLSQGCLTSISAVCSRLDGLIEVSSGLSKPVTCTREIIDACDALSWRWDAFLESCRRVWCNENEISRLAIQLSGMVDVMIYLLGNLGRSQPPDPMGIELSRWLHNERFTPCGCVPYSLRSVNEILASFVVESVTEIPGVSCEVYIEGDPGWSDVEAQYVTLPADLVRHARIAGTQTKNFILYIRQRCYQELKFLKIFVLDQSRIGRVYGHPGVGKSITALYFAADAALRRKWNVLWAHLELGSFYCLHISPDGSLHHNRLCGYEKFCDLLHSLPHPHSTNGHIVLIDGLRETVPNFEAQVLDWVQSDRATRRLVWLHSGGVVNHLNDSDASNADQAVFRQWSWRLDEYRTAMRNDAFRSNMENIDVDKKFFFAGGCARYMFGHTIGDVRMRIEANVGYYIDNFRFGVNDGNHKLDLEQSISSYFGDNTYAIVSEYAEQQLIGACGADEILRLAQNPLLNRSPKTMGVLFERFVKLKAMQLGRIETIQFNSAGSEVEITWPIMGVRDFVPNSLTCENCPMDTLMWPISDQEPTIDALILTQQVEGYNLIRVVRFIQITISETHRVNMQVLRDHMQRLKAQVAEFYFILPREPRSRILKFKPTPLSNKDSLRDYAWPGDAEGIQAKVQVVAFPGWNV